MKHQRRETIYLRALTGLAAAQVKQMRKAAGGKKAAARAAKQIAEMRAAACPAALGLLPDAGGGSLSREQAEEIKDFYGIRQDDNYINPLRK